MKKQLSMFFDTKLYDRIKNAAAHRSLDIIPFIRMAVTEWLIREGF